jgi:DNA-binding transcriptional LysR family regulator
VRGNFTTNNGSAIYDAAVRGLGVARVAQYRIADDVRHNRLRAFFSNITKSDRLIRAYYPRMLNPPAKLRAFLRFLNKQLSLQEG